MATSIKDKTMLGLGSLIKLLPTGTVFLFQFLSPVLTHNGKCKTVNKYLSGILVGVCGLSCFFSTFTDSYKDPNGNTRYGMVTRKGLWPNSGTSVDLSPYKFRIGDLVHAYFAVLVFAVVVLLDKNTMDCFYPSFHSEDLLQALPPVIGGVSGTVFALFPNTRHGIGYPSSSSSSSSGSTPSLVGLNLEEK